MSGGIFEQTKVISIETVEGHTVATIEVSSKASLYSYQWRHGNDQLINVRISSSCLPAEREAIIEICNVTGGLRYEPTDGGGEKKNEGEGDKKKEEDDDEKEGDKRRSCFCN